MSTLGPPRRHPKNIRHYSPQVTIRVTEVWGHQAGDVREFTVTRYGDQITIRTGSKAEVEMKLEVAREVYAALGEVLADDWDQEVVNDANSVS